MLTVIILVILVISAIAIFTSVESATKRAIYGDEPTVVNVYTSDKPRIIHEIAGVLYDEEGHEVDENGERV